MDFHVVVPVRLGQTPRSLQPADPDDPPQLSTGAALALLLGALAVLGLIVWVVVALVSTALG